jgi:hypothetical protein
MAKQQQVSQLKACFGVRQSNQPCIFQKILEVIRIGFQEAKRSAEFISSIYAGVRSMTRSEKKCSKKR